MVLLLDGQEPDIDGSRKRKARTTVPGMWNGDGWTNEKEMVVSMCVFSSFFDFDTSNSGLGSGTLSAQ